MTNWFIQSNTETELSDAFLLELNLDSINCIQSKKRDYVNKEDDAVIKSFTTVFQENSLTQEKSRRLVIHFKNFDHKKSTENSFLENKLTVLPSTSDRETKLIIKCTLRDDLVKAFKILSKVGNLPPEIQENITDFFYEKFPEKRIQFHLKAFGPPKLSTHCIWFLQKKQFALKLKKQPALPIELEENFTALKVNLRK